MREERRAQVRRGIPLRALIPNAITVLALCSGLTGIYFAIRAQIGGDIEDWEKAIAAIIVAGILDGLDGRVARLLKANTRFGAELDSLSDVSAFGVSPAIILYLWSLNQFRFGWIFALAHAACCALRLARFNAAIDAEEQPHKSAGFLTGVPAPAGAGLLLLPLYLWLASDRHWTWLQDYRLVAPWAALVAFLMISDLATFSWSSFRIRRQMRLGLLVGVALLGAALFTAPWETLSAAALLYVAMIPFSIASYARVRRLRASAAAKPSPLEAPVVPDSAAVPAGRRKSAPSQSAE